MEEDFNGWRQLFFAEAKAGSWAVDVRDPVDTNGRSDEPVVILKAGIETGGLQQLELAASELSTVIRLLAAAATFLPNTFDIVDD